MWVLSILNATAKDAGIYTCELNTTPLQRSFHELIGKSARLSAQIHKTFHGHSKKNVFDVRSDLKIKF